MLGESGETGTGHGAEDAAGGYGMIGVLILSIIGYFCLGAMCGISWAEEKAREKTKQ